MIKYITILVTLLFMSPVMPLSKGTTVQQPNKITLIMPAWLPLFLTKMDKEIAEKCKQQNVPFPKIEVELNPTPMLVDTTTGVMVGHILGYYTYANGVITVFLFGPPIGCYFSEKELRYTLLHELLHYIDDCRGLPKSPINHNSLFDKRLMDLGWV